MTERSRGARIIVKAFTALRDGWLIAGAVLLMLATCEVAYRGQATVRKAMAGRGASGAIKQPYADSAWYPAFAEEYAATFQMHWKPYVYFRRPAFSGKFFNVDSLGHRRTVPAGKPASDTIRIFFFGGSTMWGSNLRDAATIPSVTASLLAASTAENVSVQVTNFGESGYVSTQELLELELQLRAGHVPDVAVFYDGINDAASAAQMGEAGLPQNEYNRYREFDFGRAINGTETGSGSELRAAGAISMAALQRMQFIGRLTSMVAKPAAPAGDPVVLAKQVGEIYLRNIDIVEALSKAFGFQAIYVWQPTLHATAKVLTPYERHQRESLENSVFGRGLVTMHRALGSMLDSTAKPRFGERFINESSLFAGDTSSVFSDDIGHNTEKAIPTIVNGFMPALTKMIVVARAQPRRHDHPVSSSR